MKYILITGGCGYIGSYLSMKLNICGYKTIILDNLSTGFKNSLLHNEIFFKGDFGDTKLLEEIFNKYPVDSIFHLAASIKVEESSAKPILYYENNVAKFINFLKVIEKYNIKSFILSSTATVYADSNNYPIYEDHPTNPIHPYGKSKLMDEWILQDFAKTKPLKYIILRYFNVAGADPNLRLGQKSQNASHLIKIVSEVVCNRRDLLTIYGNNYNTKDGTCIRDYIHIEDLIDIHLKAYEYLKQTENSQIFNCGYSKGYSVQDIIQCLKEKLGYNIKTKLGERRKGDVPHLVANTDKVKKTLQWTPQLNNVEDILLSSIKWEEKYFR